MRLKPTYDAAGAIGSEIVPQPVNEAAAQAAKRIITTRMASDGKMLRLQDTDRDPQGTFEFSAGARPSGRQRHHGLCRLGLTDTL